MGRMEYMNPHFQRGRRRRLVGGSTGDDSGSLQIVAVQFCRCICRVTSRFRPESRNTAAVFRVPSKLEVYSLEGPPRGFRAQVVSSRQLTPTTRAIELEKTKDFVFRPTQFTFLQLQTEEGMDARPCRSRRAPRARTSNTRSAFLTPPTSAPSQACGPATRSASSARSATSCCTKRGLRYFWREASGSRPSRGWPNMRPTSVRGVA